MESLVHVFLWNALAATVLAAVAAGVGRIRNRPALTHSLWLLVLFKLVTPPLIPVSLPGTGAMLAVGSQSARSLVDRDHGTAAEGEPLAELNAEEGERKHFDPRLAGPPVSLAETALEIAGTDDPLRPSDFAEKEQSATAGLRSGWTWEQPVLVAILSGALAWWALATVRIIQFQRLLKDVRPVPGDWQSQTDSLSDRVGLGGRPAVCLVPGRVPPMLWAIGGRPRLLVPSQLWETMGEDERTSLLLHELAHLKRRDHWVRWLELIVAGLYWWHPVVWWARRALREAEEQCCDAWVVWAMPRQARTYAAALLAAVEFVSGARTAPAAASATSGSEHVSCLKRRLKMIVRAKTPRCLSWAGRIGVLGMAAVLLPLAPSWAQNDGSTPANPDRQSGVDEAQRSAETATIKPVSQRGNATVEVRVAPDLRSDPELSALARQIEKANDQLDISRRQNRDLIDRLNGHLERLRAEIDDTKSQLKETAEKASGAVRKPQGKLASADDLEPKVKSFPKDQVRHLIDEMIKTDLELFDARAKLDAKVSREPDDRIEKNAEIRDRLAVAAEDVSSAERVAELQRKVDELTTQKAHQAAQLKLILNERRELGDDTVLATYLNEQISSLVSLEDQAKKNLEQAKFETKQGNRVLDAEKQLSDLIERYMNLQKAKRDQFLALRTKDDDKETKARDKDDDKDDDAQVKARDAAERFHDQLKDLIEKLGKQFSPVTDEIRKALDRAVVEVHKSLDKESLSVEDLGKALEKSQEELKKAFEGGGPVDKELREAIEKSRNELQEALERGKAEVQGQVESLREKTRELTDQARENLQRAKGEMEKGVAPEGDGQPEREELESARKEIRELEQQLRTATRRLDEIQRRGMRRNLIPRRERNPRPAARPQSRPSPDAEPAQPPREPVAPATPARPADPSVRTPQPPARPGPGGARRGPQGNNERRIEELEDKMKNLLKELEQLKEDKKPAESK